MRRLMLLLAAMAAMVVGYAGAALAAPVNGDFETGDTSGWAASDPARTYVVTNFDSYQPANGTYFAVLSSGPVGIPTKLSQSFSAGTGLKLSGNTFFKTTDYLPYNDSSQVVVKLKENGDLVDTLFQKSVSDVGNYGQTPWTHWEHTFAESGEYTIEVSVTNTADSIIPSYIGLDDVKFPSYAFDGFYNPVDNPDVATNKAKAGSAIPVKFSLGGDMGLDVLANGSPSSQTIGCDTTDPVDPIEETVTAGSSSLSYDATTDQYTYVWKTQKAYAGTCRQLSVQLDDGSTHLANFQFVK